MRAWFWTLLLACLAIALALVLRTYGGNVVILVPPWRIELSLTLAVLIGLALFLAMHLSVRVFTWAARRPQSWRAWRQLRAKAREEALFISAWSQVLQGHSAQAQKDLSKLLAQSAPPQHQVLIALALAHVQHQDGHYADRDHSLERAHTAAHTSQQTDLQRLCNTSHAALLLKQGSAQAALTLLQSQQNTRDPYILRLLLQAHQQLDHHEEVHALTRLLWRRGVLAPNEARALLETCLSARLAHDPPEAFKKFWGTLKSEEKILTQVALQAANILHSQDNAEQAARILEAAISAPDGENSHNFDPRLLAAYAQCPPEHVAHRLSHAERWLKAHPDHPEVLATLGHLCLIAQLWGQAERYLLGSLRLRQAPRVTALLGHLYDRLDQPDQAMQYWRRAAAAGLPILAQDAMLPAADTRHDPNILDAEMSAAEDFSPASYPIPTTSPALKEQHES